MKQSLTTSQQNLDPQHLAHALREARIELQKVESTLAREQAAVNAFRLHCRLKLDAYVDRYLALETERQSLQTAWSLTGEGIEGPSRTGQAHAFQSCPSEPMLPTAVPHDKAAEKRLYRQLARQFHPDLGRSAVEIGYRTEMMAAVNGAFRRGDLQGLYDLAGELSPSALADLATIGLEQSRNLREQILQCQRRRRRAEQRLQALRDESTARLWRKAQDLDQKDANWWELVRRDIVRASARLADEIAWLRQQRASQETPMPTPDSGSRSDKGQNATDD